MPLQPTLDQRANLAVSRFRFTNAALPRDFFEVFEGTLRVLRVLNDGCRVLLGFVRQICSAIRSFVQLRRPRPTKSMPLRCEPFVVCSLSLGWDWVSGSEAARANGWASQNRHHAGRISIARRIAFRGDDEVLIFEQCQG